ncbi:MAG TPA: DUF1501 domain-containing protein [Planctomycetaceae bacterium]|nr:DUF1501 domain-containing protein [Planctomycetaceae bacterium]
MSSSIHENLQFTRKGIARRSFLHTVSGGALAAGTLSFRDVMSLQADELRKQGKRMILLWMQGGPSQMESFDPKPGTDNGGPTTDIETSVPGIRIAEAWANTARVMDHLTIVRSMTNKEGNHQRATYQMHTGYAPSGSVKHPSLAANLSTHLADSAFDLPSIVSVGRPLSGSGAGYLGVNFEPFVVDRAGQMPQNVQTISDAARYSRRMKLLGRVETEFANTGAEEVVKSHQKLYQQTSKMVLSKHLHAFELDRESEETRSAYGSSDFGKGCLLARRLIETGVTFVEVISRNWDTHDNNFERTTELAGQVDPGMAALIADLQQRGMLDDTLVVWMGEFGRTPRINPRTGRDHFPRAFSAVLAGAGVKGGQVIGSTTKDGSAVADQPVTAGDLFASICHSLGVDQNAESISPLGRPMKIVEEGSVVEGLFA